MDFAARFGPGDPAGLAGVGGGATVEGGGELQGDERQALGHALQEACVEVSGLIGHHTLGQGDACSAEHGVAFAGHSRVGVG